MRSQKSITQTIAFGSKLVPTSQLFISRKNVYGMVNLKPQSQGHVLVCTKRVTSKLSDLTELETLEFWCTIQEVSKVMADIYKTDCLIAIQDGKEAGQTIEHVHCHIIPKHKDMLMGVESKNPEPRQLEDMIQEAQKYRPYFEQSAL